MSYDFQTFQNLSKQQLDASSAAMSQVANGLQAIAKESADFSKKSIENGSAYLEKLLSVKNLDDAISLHTTFAKQSYEAFVSEAAKIGELYSNVAKEAMKPMSEAVNKIRQNAPSPSASSPMPSAPAPFSHAAPSPAGKI